MMSEAHAELLLAELLAMFAKGMRQQLRAELPTAWRPFEVVGDYGEGSSL